ncbi:hypothetical protein NL364_27715, partial [Klebsiella pneumoniae]|nr:hypothetical protein [Klebsiella pneumoniae]
HREASWVFYRRPSEGAGAALAAALLPLLDREDPLLRRDRERLSEVRAARETQAQAYFARHAAQWDAIRSLRVPEALVEQQVRDALGDAPIEA